MINSALRTAASEPLDIEKARQIARRTHGVILIDTSAWIGFLRGAGSAACNRAGAAFESDMAVCGAIRLEALAGDWEYPDTQKLRVHGHDQVSNGVGFLKGFIARPVIRSPKR